MNIKIHTDKAYTLVKWKELVLSRFPNATITQEDGRGNTYGDVGDWTAHTGPDMQVDVVGVFTQAGYCSVWDVDLGDFTDLVSDGNVEI